LLGRLDDLPTVYRRLPYGLAVFTLFSLVGVSMMRIIHFVGLETLFHLLVGTYHRPVQEQKVLLFLDVNDSTALGVALGPLATRALMRKFLADVSQPIIDFGGDIYLYKGDGLIATWNWAAAMRHKAVLSAVDAMFQAIERDSSVYESLCANSRTTFAVSCTICPCLFLPNFLIWNFLFRADGDSAV
jgi:hypothetical protein